MKDKLAYKQYMCFVVMDGASFVLHVRGRCKLEAHQEAAGDCKRTWGRPNSKPKVTYSVKL